ncbi:MAG: VanW family protein, partial [Eubacterium sp.]|nr:VanW family protein [Eubacterium sp.]
MKRISALFIAAIMLVSCSVFPIMAYAEGERDISTAQITVVETFEYSPTKNPDVTVKMNIDSQSIQLVENTDYKLTYYDNEKVGKASVTIEGMGSYKGSVSKNYEIIPCSIASSHIKVENTAKATINGAPEYDVYYDDELLTEGVDYNMTVSDYSEAGSKKTKVKLQGLGNFDGEHEFSVNVYPTVVSSFSTTDRTISSFILHWSSLKDYGASGYKVYVCDENGEDMELYSVVDTNKCKITGANPGEYYYFVVKAFVKDGDKTLTGEASKVFKTCTKPAKGTLLGVYKSKDKTKLIINWKKAACTGYEIEYSADKKFKTNVKKLEVKGASTTSKTVKIAKNNKTYYARVRAFRRYNSNKVTVYGERSAKMSSSFKKLYSSYTTRYVNNPKRTNNLKLACKAINGTIVKPGETFSFNGTVGMRTAAKGYKEAYVFTGPDSHQLGLGGGVCQVASTMFNAALLGNLQIVERHQHSQRVTYCPLGRDAAIYWGSENFRFKNNTNYPIKIVMKCEGGSLTCSYYVSENVSHKKVNLSVSRSGNHFTLR